MNNETFIERNQQKSPTRYGAIVKLFEEQQEDSLSSFFVQ
jgi:hypothetical protein